MNGYTNLKREEVADSLGVPLTSVSGVELLKGGSENSNFKVIVDRDPVVITLFEEKTQRSVERIADLYIHLEKMDFPAPRLQKYRQASTVRMNNKPGIAKSFIEGSVLKELTSHQIKSLGSLIGRLHSIPSTKYLPIEPNFGLSFMTSQELPEQDIEFEQWLTGAIQGLLETDFSHLPVGMIHADIFPDNLIFEKRRLKALIDFEEACTYSLMFEIGMAIVGCCRFGNNLDMQGVRSLISGYQEKRALQQSEIEMIPYFVGYGTVVTAFWRYWKQFISESGAGSKFSYGEMQEFSENQSIHFWEENYDWQILKQESKQG